VLKNPAEISGAYADTKTAEDYIDTRFTSAWGSVLHAAQVRVINDTIQRHGARRVLEIAPGPARLSHDVSGFERGYLCEFNESMVRVARTRLADTNGRWQLLQGDAFRLPFGPALNADLVYTFRFIRHFERADRTRLYNQIRSVLRPGGLLVFDAVNRTAGLAARVRDGLDTHPVFDEFYRPVDLRAELLEEGFELLSLTDVMRHMALQQSLQVYIGPRSNALARALIQGLEYVPGDPLEWIVVCRKTA
jgi:SAM-dependent methyltransferase